MNKTGYLVNFEANNEVVYVSPLEDGFVPVESEEE